VDYENSEKVVDILKEALTKRYDAFVSIEIVFWRYFWYFYVPEYYELFASSEHAVDSDE